MERRIKFLELRKIKSVAFQGERGAFSEPAAKKFFTKKISLLPCLTFEDVFNLITRKKVDAGVIPIENSLQGSILETYDLLQRYHLSIIGEVKLRIIHHLLANREASLHTIRSVYSHPQALAQCGSYLRSLPNVRSIPWYDTAGAARMVMEKDDNTIAAIAGAEAAKVYGLKILRPGIEDNHANYTRFVVLARLPVRAMKQAKTSIIFSVKNIPGALFAALKPFADRGINLHKIESRPVIGKPWEYVFYVDFSGSAYDSGCSEAIRDLRGIATRVKVLGSYPRG